MVKKTKENKKGLKGRFSYKSILTKAKPTVVIKKVEVESVLDDENRFFKS